MIGYFVVALLACVAHGQYLAECPPEDYEVATFRLMTRDLPPLAIPNANRMEKDRSYAVDEIKGVLLAIPDLGQKIVLPENYLTDPFVERCCPKTEYNCTSIQIELRFVKYQNGICWIVWPDWFFVYTRCTCCTCLLNDECPVVGRCVETDYVTVKVLAYCHHIMYSDRFQKLAIRIPTACECAASCPVPQSYFYKKHIIKW